MDSKYADDFLSKPFNSEVLLARAKAVLQNLMTMDKTQNYQKPLYVGNKIHLQEYANHRIFMQFAKGSRK